MTFKRIKAISKLLLLFGTPLAVVLGLFSSGVYYGVEHQARIATFEREWLGLDVDVVSDPEDTPSSIPSDRTDPPAVEGRGGSARIDEGHALEETPDRAAPEVRPGVDAAVRPTPADASARDHRSVDSSSLVPPGPSTPATGDEDARPVDERSAPMTSVDVPLTQIDPLDDALERRLAVPIVVHVKVLVDPALIEQRADWIDYVQRTVSQASQIYEKQFGMRLELSGVARWSVATAGMSSIELLEDLEQRTREGADVLLGFTERPLDGATAGRAQSPTPDDPFNGAYGVVYATPRHRNPHLRTLLHEVGHMFGAIDVTDPEDPAYVAGSFMSYAWVPENQAPWIDPENRERVLARKDRAFRPESLHGLSGPESDHGPFEAGGGGEEP